MLINIIVALSNLYGLRIFTLNLSIYEMIFMGTLMIASILMHLSEVKHDLPGIYPFDKLSNEFLWFDRIMANLALVFILYKIYQNPMLFDDIINEGLIGLFLVVVSERINIGKIGFMITHSAWHVIAFDIIYKILE